jgi:hypothetical protein
MFHLSFSLLSYHQVILSLRSLPHHPIFPSLLFFFFALNIFEDRVHKAQSHLALNMFVCELHLLFVQEPRGSSIAMRMLTQDNEF